MTHEEALLMPRYAPRPPPDPSLDEGRRHDARELAMLEGQLEALERDIRSARPRAATPHSGFAALRAPERRARPHGARIRLRDGLEIHVRAIEPGDAPLLKEAFDRLTALTRYKRFLGSLDHLSSAQLRYLTTVDHIDHEAVVALDGESGAVVGVARYLRDRRDPRLAEIAVVVIDTWQRRGVATALLGRLAARAHAAGIERVVARSIVGDHSVRVLAARAGLPVAAQDRSGITEFRCRVPVDAASTVSPAEDEAVSARTPMPSRKSLWRASVPDTAS